MYRVILAFGSLLLCVLALAAGSGSNVAARPSSSEAAPSPPQAIDCSQVKRLGLDKQTNLHAADVLRQCGYGGETAPPAYQPAPPPKGRRGPLINRAPARPTDYGGQDVDVIIGPPQLVDSNPQSSGSVWGNGNTIVAVYNDFTGPPQSSAAGLSYSTDGGATFTRVLPSPIGSGHGTTYGDPRVVYDAHLGRWYAVSFASGCGGQGFGLWTSIDGINWTAGVCAHNGTSDDRPTMWADNSPSSPYYGRIYISWNDFAAGQFVYVAYSDGGTQWSTPVRVEQVVFIRNVHITGSPVDGTVYIAGMDEGGGGLNARTGEVYRSTSGGATWTSQSVYAPFAAPGVGVCTSNAYFAMILPGWREMGWGQLGVDASGTLHYAHTVHGPGIDPGDIYYTRSTDNGVTWSVPMRLNTDSMSREQWQPSLSVTAGGTVMASWYDRRDTTDYSYRLWGRASSDGGLSWLPDQPVSDTISPYPDSTSQGCFGDDHYVSAYGNTSYLTWTDYRNLVSGTPQPDVYFDRVQLGQVTATPTSTPGGIIRDAFMQLVPQGNAPPNGGTANVGDRFVLGLWANVGTQHGDLVPAQESYLTFTHALLQNARVDQIPTACVLTSTLTPDLTGYDAVLQNEVCNGPNPCIFPIGGPTDPGSIAYASGCLCQFAYGSWRVAQMGLCAVAPGRAVLHWQFSPPAPLNRDTQIIDVQGNRIENRALFTDYVINVVASPTPTLTPTRTPTPCNPYIYFYSTATATVVPGSNDTGNHCDDCNTAITLPFQFLFYGQSFTTAYASSNGILSFAVAGSALNQCLPKTDMAYSMLPYHDDLVTTSNYPGCEVYATGCGVFTSTGGVPPSRIYNVEWRAVTHDTHEPVNFEVRLFEGSYFEFIYGQVSQGGNSATVGILKVGVIYVQYSCNTSSLGPGLQIRWVLAIDCDPTASPTSTRTPTRTATSTPTQCQPIIYFYSTATATIVPGVTDTGNHCDDCMTQVSLPFPFTLYNQTATTVYLSSNGFLTLLLTGFNLYKCLPKTGQGAAIFTYNDDLLTSNDTGCQVYPTGCGIFTSVSGSAPNRIFNIEWRTVTFSANDPVNFELRLYETPMWGLDFVYGQVSQSGSSAIVGVQDGAYSFTQYSCNTPSLRSGLRISNRVIAAGCDPTASPTRTRTPTATATRTPTPCLPGNYTYTTTTATIVPGTVDIGNHCDDCNTTITMPFPVTLYDITFTTAIVSSNGILALLGISNVWPVSCLPNPNFDTAVVAHWDDLRTDTLGTCTPGPCGIYSSVSGTAPNRIFNIEWRTYYFTGPGNANFEIRLYEGLPSRFDIVLGRLDQGGTSATIGVQEGPSGRGTQFECNTSAPNNTRIAFTFGSCGTGTPTPTPTQCAANYVYTTATATIVPGTVDTGNHCDDCQTTITLPFAVRFYNQTFTTAVLDSNGGFNFGSVGFGPHTCPPHFEYAYGLAVNGDDLRTDLTGVCNPGPCGIYTSVTGSAPNRIFNIEWRAYYFTGPGNAYFEARLYENSAVQQVDYVYGRVDQSGGSVGVARDIAVYTCYPGSPSQGLKIAWTLPPCGTGTPTPTPTQCLLRYTYTTATATIDPNLNRRGEQCPPNDGSCVIRIPLPFPFKFYGQLYSAVGASQNGNLQFLTEYKAFTNTCLPADVLGPAIFPHWDDLRTDTTGTCSPGPCGIYTAFSGSAPDRTFYIEWRAYYFTGAGSANFEVQLHEGSPSRFDVVIDRLDQGGTSATIGVQDGNGDYTQYECNISAPNRLKLSFVEQGCGTSTPTPTPTRTSTPTATQCLVRYTYTTATATIDPGEIQVNPGVCDCVFPLPLPFPFKFYEQFYDRVNVSSTGTLQFVTKAIGYTNVCLPAEALGPAILPFWDDLRIDHVELCPGGCGVFTSVRGSPPNRIFNIEWRAFYFTGAGNANFEVRLYEGPPSRFEIVTGRIDQNSSATTGVQDGAAAFTQYQCNTSISNNLRIAFTLQGCGTPTSTPSPTPTATPCGSGFGTWGSAAAVPTARARALGVNYGNFIYLFGGRPDANTYSNALYRYELLGDSWAQLPFTLPDLYTSNMGGGLLTFPEGQRIFIVGGSGPGSAMTGRTLAFDPGTGVFTPKALWPATPTRLPGGWAVANNKLYVFGGFEVNVAMHDETWVYDPMSNNWTQLPARLSIARGYIATETMPDGLIYLAGGSEYIAGFLTDQTRFEKFNPAIGTIVTGPPVAYARSNNQGYNFQGKFVMPSGGALTFTDDVQVYDPATNSWSLGPHIPNATRNYARGYGLNGSILVIGGTDETDYLSNNQRFSPGGPCGSATPTPTSGATTPTATATSSVAPTSTATSCPMTFSDVHPADYFYEAVRYLYCAGVISGYSDGTFRPYNNTTRGQMCKIIVLARGWQVVCPDLPTFRDVPRSHPFYCYIETAYQHNIISGYNCGPGCREFRPENNVTRGQVCKIVVLAMGWAVHCPDIGHFVDVLPSDPFYCYIETAYEHGIISGYSDGTFRSGNSATRGQICVIVYRAIVGP